MLKYHSKESTTFYDPNLYVAILSHNDVVITIKNEFAKHLIYKKIPYVEKRMNQNINFEKFGELIIQKKK